MWDAKQQIICSLSESLWDVYNYGLFQPAAEGRDAKFLEEEQALRNYSQSFETGVPYLEVRRKMYSRWISGPISCWDEDFCSGKIVYVDLKKLLKQLKEYSVSPQ